MGCPISRELIRLNQLLLPPIFWPENRPGDPCIHSRTALRRGWSGDSCWCFLSFSNREADIYAIQRTSERASEHLGSTSAVPHESLQAPTFSSKMKTRITQPALKIYPVHNDVAHKGQVNLPLANTYGGRLRLAKASLGEAPDVDIQVRPVV